MIPESRNQHDGAELFDLAFLHAGPNMALCCYCGDIEDLGDPDILGSTLAQVHRILCEDGPGLN